MSNTPGNTTVCYLRTPVDKDQHGHPPTRISHKTQIPTNGDSASNRNFGQNVKETAQAHGALVLVGKNELEVS